MDLKFETTAEAIQQRKQFLKDQRIGICDIVDSARRDKIDASDLGMRDVELRNLIDILQKHKGIETLLFMGGNSKNGPEYFFRKLIKNYEIKYEVVSNEVPRVHAFALPSSERIIKTVSLIAPSGSANRAVGSLDEYKAKKSANPEYNTLDYRIEQYSRFFTE